MMRRQLILGTAVVLAGCAATVTRPPEDKQPLALGARPATVALLITGTPTVQASADWQTFRAEWRTAFAAAAGSAGMNHSYLETEPASPAAGTLIARVHVNDYRYVSTGARMGFGVMTGNAFVDAEVRYLEYPGARVAGTRRYATTSTAWQGIFSAMTDKQLAAISAEMVKEIGAR